MEWSFFNQFNDVSGKYLPRIGEGDTKATQIVTAVSKLVYKWYNDGDVYDNTYALEGWANDLSSYANWLAKNTDAASILNGIRTVSTEEEYEEHVLAEIAMKLFDMEYLDEMNKHEKVGSIYECEGPFCFKEQDEEDDFYW